MTTLAPRPGLVAPRLATDAPALWRLMLLILLALAPLAAAMALDSRQIESVSIWLKPVKFHIALAIYLATLAFFARFLPTSMLSQRGYRVFQALVIAAITAELVWIGGAAAVGTTSHFNDSTPFWSILYGLMGLAATLLTSLSLVFGVAILRNRQTGLQPALRAAIGWGLVLTFPLTLITAGTMSATSGHFVGTPADPTHAVWLMGWSREVGDLRVAHFLATHTLHAVPVAGWLAVRFAPASARGLVWVAMAGWAALTLGTFAQALMGLPLIP
jgi:predicted small integral membrane protein